MSKDHPRVCGEKESGEYWNDKHKGSPPRMRGKVQLQPGQPAALGITPAYAGKSAQLEGAPPLAQDHPRVCGEKRLKVVRVLVQRGSPPRMRGKEALHHGGCSERGITPAYAGKSLCIGCGGVDDQDHPRVCGEKDPDRDPGSQLQGSPPRMRGKGIPFDASGFARGITPAYAGKSSPAVILFSRRQDHPRVCGEKEKTYADITVEKGSPPRMRGKDAVQFRNRGQKGITPAYAGKS